MPRAEATTPVPTWMEHGTTYTEAELAVREAAALLGALVVGLLHVADAVLEAWPLPSSRARR